jgi:hypothetical protein
MPTAARHRLAPGSPETPRASRRAGRSRRRPRGRATVVELRAAMRGDELVPDPASAVTRAITIDAPPELVWPWVAQLGRPQPVSAGLRVVGADERADEVRPDLLHPRIGDPVVVPGGDSERTTHRVAGVEPSAWLLWAKPGSTWSWRLVPLPGEGTRLVLRVRQRYDWRAPGPTLRRLLRTELGAPTRLRRTLRGIRVRAERLRDQATVVSDAEVVGA